MKNKLVVFDAYAIIYRAYFALPKTLTDLNNEPINAVYGLISMLFKVIEDTQPSHIAFAYDTKEKTFRDEIYKDYRTQREAPETELISQFEKSIKAISAFNIPIYSKVGFEADDVIGTITEQITRNKLQETNALVVTGDRDMLQLVNKQVHLYMPGKSLNDAIEYDEQKTFERMGVMPEKIVDLKALVGDSADNYKGVPGIGPKTAIKLLTEYGKLKTIYENLDNLPDRTRKLLEENRESAFLSQKLARIVTDLDINFKLEDTEKWQLWSEKVEKTFNEFGFKTLKKRAEKLSKELELRKQGSLF